MERNRAAQRAVALGLLGLLAWGCGRNACSGFLTTIGFKWERGKVAVIG